MNKPLKIYMNYDHLAIALKELPDEKQLAIAFEEACKPLNLTFTELHNKIYCRYYGEKEELFDFLQELSRTFDITLI